MYTGSDNIPSNDRSVSVFLLNGEKQGGRSTDKVFDSSTRRSQRLWKKINFKLGKPTRYFLVLVKLWLMVDMDWC